MACRNITFTDYQMPQVGGSPVTIRCVDREGEIEIYEGDLESIVGQVIERYLSRRIGALEYGDAGTEFEKRIDSLIKKNMSAHEDFFLAKMAEASDKIVEQLVGDKIEKRIQMEVESKLEELKNKL